MTKPLGTRVQDLVMPGGNYEVRRILNGSVNQISSAVRDRTLFEQFNRDYRAWLLLAEWMQDSLCAVDDVVMEEPE